MPNTNYTADAVMLSDLLSTASAPIVVPDWQRSYSWKSDQIETFWADLMRFHAAYPQATIVEQQYFLGSIVMVTSSEALLLLDGQQRVATATILLSSLREHRRPLDAAAAQRLQLKFIADYDDGSKQTQYSVTMNRYDREFFRKRIQSEGFTNATPRLRSHSLIASARAYFDAALEHLTTGLTDDEALELNVRLQDVLLKHVSVVSVRSGDEDTAATVFEALNDRGIGLSTPDLLRSFLLRSAAGETERQRIVESWLEVFSMFEESGVEAFLRHYWVSLNGDVKTRSLYREMKADFAASGLDPVAFSENLARAAADYRALKDGSDDNEAIRRSLEGINQLNAAVLYPALMSALAVRESVDPPELEGFVEDLLILYVRHSLILGRDSTKLEAEVFSVAQDVRASGSLGGARERIRSFAPTLGDFARAFKVAVVSRTESAKYLLRQIEQSLRGTDELVLANGRRVQLEHIYPQTPPAGERLEAHASLVNRLGNLTLLDHRLNAGVKNANFSEKRARAYNSSELVLTNQLVRYEVERWGATEIDNRQAGLAEIAAKVWSFGLAEYEALSASGVAGSPATTPPAEHLPIDAEEDAPAQ